MVRSGISAAAATIFEDMSDQCIYEALKKRGKNPGPVTATTRELYCKMLASMPDYAGESSSSVKVTTTTPRKSSRNSVAKEVPVRSSAFPDYSDLYEEFTQLNDDPYAYEDVNVTPSTRPQQQREPKPMNFDEHTAAGGWDDEVDDDDTPPIIQLPDNTPTVRDNERGIHQQEPRQEQERKKGIWRSLPAIAAVIIVGVIVARIFMSVAPKTSAEPEEPTDELDRLLNSMKLADL